MPDLLHLFSASGLADLGRDSIAAFWLPLLAWTAFAGLAELALRLTRTHPTVAVRVRSGLLLALPLTLLVPPLLAWALPDAAHAVAVVRPPQFVLPEITAPLPTFEAPSPPTGWMAIGLVTLTVLVAGATGLARWAWALGRLRHVRRTLAPAPETLQVRLDALRQATGLRQRVAAAECDPGTAPFTFGWRRPVIAVPPTLSGEPLRLALAHELAHVRHRDFLWNAIEQGIASAGLAHPLVGLVARGAMLGREQAADAAVLAASPTDRRTYADLLLSYASLPAPGLTLGAAQGSSLLHTRIAAMTRILSPSRIRQLAIAGRSVGLLAVVLLVGGAAALAVPDTAEAQSEWLEGRVYDDQNDQGIAAANLVIEVDGTRVGAATDLEGAYRLRRPEGAFAMLVTAPGYIPRSVLVEVGQNQIDIALRSQTDRAAAYPMVDPSPDGEPQAPVPDVFEVVEEAPRLIGGLEGLQQRVVYPQEAKDAGIEGRVFITFIVDKEGRVQDPRIARSADPMLDEAALQAVRASEFIPGRQRGQAVKVRYSLPVNFSLRGGSPRSGANRPRPAPGPDANGIFNVVEQAPRLIGGLEGLQARVEYPELAERAGIQGRVFVTFVVDELGQVQDAAIARSPDPILSEAALKAVQESEFSPGLQRGQPVKVRYSLPVNFRLPIDNGSDGEDRGSNRTGEAPQGRFHYTGVDLTTLENGAAMGERILSIPATMETRDGAPGSAEIQYLVRSDGRTTATEITVTTLDGVLGEIARSIVEEMVVHEGRRPGTTWAGTFRVAYSKS
ncbi:MAG: hypothetical protein Rubg2KO_05010 [Rubricoccaceae bacterium]